MKLDRVKYSKKYPDVDREMFKIESQYRKYFNKCADIKDVILTGHLLIEQSIIRAITWSVKYNLEFSPADFSFLQLLEIGNMMDITPWYKREITALNTLKLQINYPTIINKKYISLIINTVYFRKQIEFEDLENKFLSLTQAIGHILNVIDTSYYDARREFYLPLVKLPSGTPPAQKK